MKKPTKPALSFERHEQFSEFLRFAQSTLRKMQDEVARSHNSKRQRSAARALFQAHQKIDDARSELEEVMFLDHPGQASIQIYYGPEGNTFASDSSLNAEEFKSRLRIVGGNPDPNRGKDPPF